HTRGHIAFVDDHLLFCGDTLFSARCGRLFEGTAAQMHASLARLAALPGTTRGYCRHEYTPPNPPFAQAGEADHCDLAAYVRHAEAARARGEPTRPSTIEPERRVTPFLRAGEPAVRAAAERHAGRPLADEVEIFAELRRWKDHYRG